MNIFCNPHYASQVLNLEHSTLLHKSDEAQLNEAIERIETLCAEADESVRLSDDHAMFVRPVQIGPNPYGAEAEDGVVQLLEVDTNTGFGVMLVFTPDMAYEIGTRLQAAAETAMLAEFETSLAMDIAGTLGE